MRAACKARRERLKSEERDEALCRAFLLSPFVRAESFLVYRSVSSEAGTERIIAELLSRGKRVLLPRVGERGLEALPFGETKRGKFGIQEPVFGTDEPCEVVLAPLIAADAEGYRLGYGGGYFDGYFARRKEAARVGLAYAGQAVERLPRDEWDVPLDALVTEEGTILYDSRAAWLKEKFQIGDLPRGETYVAGKTQKRESRKG